MLFKLEQVLDCTMFRVHLGCHSLIKLFCSELKLPCTFGSPLSCRESTFVVRLPTVFRDSVEFTLGTTVAVPQQQRCVRLWTIIGYVRHISIVILSNSTLRLADVGKIARIPTKWQQNEIKCHHPISRFVSDGGRD